MLEECIADAAVVSLAGMAELHLPARTCLSLSVGPAGVAYNSSCCCSCSKPCISCFHIWEAAGGSAQGGGVHVRPACLSSISGAPALTHWLAGRKQRGYGTHCNWLAHELHLHAAAAGPAGANLSTLPGNQVTMGDDILTVAVWPRLRSRVQMATPPPSGDLHPAGFSGCNSASAPRSHLPSDNCNACKSTVSHAAEACRWLSTLISRPT